jgi:type I site-specific restriction endonuclease
MSMNEADTRYHLIDPLLRAKGYVSRAQITLETILTPSPVEPTGAKGRRRKGPGRTDYLLCVQLCVMPKPLPIAVLEAKKESEDPLAGMQQAKGYADGERFDVKYVFATNGHRYGEFDCVTKPALSLCDRDELREQAYTNLKAAFGDNARIVKTERGSNAARNARIHIATYQTLGLDDDDDGFASFLSEHYGENAFSVIIIDECHRSAWGRWSEVLRRNPNAIHIGLTATPRQLHEAKNAPAEDREITANNRKYHPSRLPKPNCNAAFSRQQVRDSTGHARIGSLLTSKSASIRR